MIANDLPPRSPGSHSLRARSALRGTSMSIVTHLTNPRDRAETCRISSSSLRASGTVAAYASEGSGQCDRHGHPPLQRSRAIVRAPPCAAASDPVERARDLHAVSPMFERPVSGSW